MDVMDSVYKMLAIAKGLFTKEYVEGVILLDKE